jgi:glycosyltransferase involved in cell wall biosynthesis
MNLCLVTHKIIKGDGQGRVNYEIVCEAIRRGHRMTLLASSIAPELLKDSQVDGIIIPVHTWPTELLRNMVFAWNSSRWLREHRTNFDLVKVNGAITTARGDINAAHFVHSSWLRSPEYSSGKNLDLDGLYQRLYTALNASWEKQAFAKSKVVVAVSTRVKQELIEIGVPTDRIRVILNGVDLHEFAPGEVDRSKFGLPQGVTLALFAGDIRTPRKNLDTVLHALVQVPELHLAIAGITEGSPYLELAKELNLSERVHFLGHRQDVPHIMKVVDFLVFPSRYETFGLVVLEAMATRLPVITASTTGASEVVTPDCGVVLLDPNDTQTLAKELNVLTKEPQKRLRMGQAARAEAEKHSWENMAQHYVDLFEELAK